ncbi:MAG: zinc-finger-containing protein [Oscillospiraceae bacterium]
MKKNKKSRKGHTNHRMLCPYCKSPVIYRTAEGIYHEDSKDMMLYVCSRYPECDAYVRVHTGTNIPVGSLANHKLRALRRDAHRHFNQLYTSGLMSKQGAYDWLAGLIGAPLSQAHIGYLGEYYCNQVIDESKKILEHNQHKLKKSLCGSLNGGVPAS